MSPLEDYEIITFISTTNRLIFCIANVENRFLLLHADIARTHP
jgi:hypothetical protein